MNSLLPVVGDWYRHPNTQPFEVVAIDNDEATVEVQYYDGAVEELDFDAWAQTPVESVEPPEDWGSGSMDMEKDDFSVEFDDRPMAAYASPLDFLDLND